MSHRKSCNMVLIPAGAEIFPPWAILYYTEPVIALTHVLLIYLCPLYFLLLELHELQSCADKVLALNMNTWLPLFWSTFSLACGPGLDHMCWRRAWAVISEIAYPQSKVPEKAWLFFFWIVENTEKLWPTLMVFPLTSPILVWDGK